MKAEVFFESFDMEGLLQRFGKKIPGIGFMGKTFVKHPKNLESFALPIAKKVVKDKGFDVEIKSITVDADGPTVKGIAVELGHIDYAQVSVAALPIIRELLEKKKPDHVILKALTILDADAPALARATASTVSDAKKERLICLMAEEYSDLLAAKGNGLLEKKRLPVKLSGVSVTV